MECEGHLDGSVNGPAEVPLLFGEVHPAQRASHAPVTDLTRLHMRSKRFSTSASHELELTCVQDAK